MPDRIIRDELLTSERYWSVSMQAQQLYIHLLLVVDDAARFSGKNFTLRAACFPGRPLEAADLERMMSELVDVDLVRLYAVGAERFVFVPRFRNRRRYVGASKYPDPPNEINDLPKEKSASSQPQDSPEPDLSQPEVSPKTGGVGVGEGLVRDIEPTALVGKADAFRPPDCPFQELLAAYHELCPSMSKVRVMTNMRYKHCRARWIQVCTDDKCGKDDAMEFFRGYFRMAQGSRFLTGRSAGGPYGKDRAWKADFEWLMNAGNFAKVVEGKYNDERQST